MLTIFPLVIRSPLIRTLDEFGKIDFTVLITFVLIKKLVLFVIETAPYTSLVWGGGGGGDRLVEYFQREVAQRGLFAYVTQESLSEFLKEVCAFVNFTTKFRVFKL